MPLDSRKQLQRTDCRLHKFLALCGLGSRRACERLIDAGRVSVDRCIVRHQGVCIDTLSQVVMLDGKRVFPDEKVTILLNKPRDVLCTSSDPYDRRTFKSLLPALSARVYTVGRLDRNSEGLLLVTNDGQLAYALTHPRFQIEKVYHVWIKQKLTQEQEQNINKGVRSNDEILHADKLVFLGARGKANLYRVSLREGRNRHIRRMFEAIGVEITRLKRIAIGPLKLGHLCSGAWRYVNNDEIEMLLGRE